MNAFTARKASSLVKIIGGLSLMTLWASRGVVFDSALWAMLAIWGVLTWPNEDSDARLE